MRASLISGQACDVAYWQIASLHCAALRNLLAVVGIRRYDGVIVAAINMGAHVDRVSTGEMIDRFLPLLRDASAWIKSMLL